MKKNLLSIFLFALLFATLISTTSFAEEAPLNSSNQTLFVATEETPQSVLDYAISNFPTTLENFCSSNNINIDGKRFTLGTPIKIANIDDSSKYIYNFIVLCDNQIFTEYSVYDVDGDRYAYQMGNSKMVEELKKLVGQTTSKTPLKFVSYNDNFYGILDTQVINMSYHSSDSVDINDLAIPFNDNSDGTNIMNTIYTIDNLESFRSDTPTTFAYANPLPVTAVLQGDKNWCGAACTASIINFVKGKNLTAKDVTVAALGSDLDEGITNAQVKSVAKSYSITPTSGNPLSYSNVKTQIDKGAPVYMQMQRSTGTGKAYHALVLIGYSSTKYTLKNPWFSDSMTLDKQDNGSSVTYKTDDRVYTWYTSVYNWR